MEWEDWIEEQNSKPYMQELKTFLTQESAVYPPKEKIFSAFKYTPWDAVKVVILGQDPYHGEGQAEGLSFSVPKGVKIPPSLANIFRELQGDLQIAKPTHGSLVHWAKQGVLLLNSILTVRPNEPKSHAGRGWEIFTNHVVELLFQKKTPLVFLLWGKTAIEAYPFLQTPSLHLILTAPHPSPFSAHLGFLGCRHFSQTNKFLKLHNLKEIDWTIPCEE
jgi:uracil-DNA glycosylase